MPDEQHNSTTPPLWATTLLQPLFARIEHLETQVSSSPLLSHDPNVIIRSPGSDFTPTVDMLERHPYITEDFFRRPMDETQRRRYLFDCPKNSLRQYDPPKLNSVQLSPQAKLVDTQLYQLQYRLSGITRPLDWFTYQLLQNQWDPHTMQQQSHDIVTAIQELLSDLASYVTTLRTQNAYRGIPGRVEPPPESDENLLLDTTAMVEHIKLQRTVQQLTSQPQSNKKRNNRPRSKRSAQGDSSNNATTTSAPVTATNDANHVAQTSSHQSSSRGFQARTHTKRTN